MDKDHFLANSYNKIHKVPQYKATFFPPSGFVSDGIVLREGSWVSWMVDQRKKDNEKFRATGKIIGFYMTTFGGSTRKMGARIETIGKYLEIYPGRKVTTVSVDKLKPA